MFPSLIPYSTKSGAATDALRLLHLATNDDRNRRVLAISTLTRLFLSGVRVRDLPVETINAATAIQDGTAMELMALQLRWAYELTHDRPATDATLNRILILSKSLGNALNPEWRSSLAQIQAHQAVFIRHDADAGELLMAGAISEAATARAAKATLSAAIAALRRSPELPEKIEAARKAIQAAQLTTNISFDWEYEWLDLMAKGWPMGAEGPVAGPLVAYPRSN